MLFNSFVFIFAFLPLSLLLTYRAGTWNQTAAKVALLCVSFVFYAWWRLSQLPLLLISIAFNYVAGEWMQRARAADRPRQVQAILVVGVLADVLFLGWFKYANFVVDNLNWAAGSHIQLDRIALPLAISFFTFQKIAYLIDTARGETRPVRVLDFSLFAAFYPQLIAGPIVHFREVMPQLQKPLFGKLIARNLMVGLVLFSIGLFKKTVLADTLAIYVKPLYEAARQGQELGFISAWVAGVGFTFQLYFDFSGYSDMAIGLGRMLGVKLPLNFHSPLRAASITDYWRRWHMTLQRFVVAYIFQPLSLPLTRFAADWNLTRWSGFPPRYRPAGIHHLCCRRSVARRRVDFRPLWRDARALSGRERSLAGISGQPPAPAQARRPPPPIAQTPERSRLPPRNPLRRRRRQHHVPSGDAGRRRPDLAQHDRIRNWATPVRGAVQ